VFFAAVEAGMVAIYSSASFFYMFQKATGRALFKPVLVSIDFEAFVPRRDFKSPFAQIAVECFAPLCCLSRSVRFLTIPFSLRSMCWRFSLFFRHFLLLA
jgi:hypothetical protein